MKNIAIGEEAMRNIAIGSAALIFCAACGGDHPAGPTYTHEPDLMRTSLVLTATPQHLLLGEPVNYTVTVEGARGCTVFLYFPSGLDPKISDRVAKWETYDQELAHFSIIRWPVVRGELVASAILVHPRSNTILAQAHVTIIIE